MIVECPGCKNRYDVTGRPPGTRARCRCNTIFTLPEPPGVADEIACPRCGGNVPPTNHNCEYCSAALLVKACPRCFSRVFHGSKHCSHCGADVVVPATAHQDGSASPRACPHCDDALVGRLVADVLLDECPKCHGVFVDVTALERILKERRQARADAVLGTKRAEAVVDSKPKSGRMYIKCPDCETVMNRRNFARGAGVIIDTCKDHGTWFDANELPAVIAFVQDGGLERAQQKNARELYDEARRKDAQGRVDRLDKPVSSTGEYHSGAALGDLLDAIGSIFW